MYGVLTDEKNDRKKRKNDNYNPIFQKKKLTNVFDEFIFISDEIVINLEHFDNFCNRKRQKKNRSTF